MTAEHSATSSVAIPSTQEILPIQLDVQCATTVFQKNPVAFDRWAPLNYLVGPNGSGKTTLFNSIMAAARGKWPNKVKILGTGRLGPLEKSVSNILGDMTQRLFSEDSIEAVYGTLFSGQDTAHQAFQLLEKRRDLQLRVLGFLRHVFKKTLHFKSTRRGLVITGVSVDGASYQIVDECHGLKELITILTFLYDDTFSVLGIDEPELHLHPQFQRFLLDEIKQVAGDPGESGKKLVFLVTHSPILLELRRLQDLASVLVFSPGVPPRRAQLDSLTSEEVLKVRQALPAFHAGQRELLFCNTPILVEGPSDSSVLLNVATKLELPIGAAGLGVAPMGGKYQLLAYRALLGSLAKTSSRFVLDRDTAVSPQVLSCLDNDERVVAYLAKQGLGGQSLSAISGALIGDLKSLVKSSHSGGTPFALLGVDADGTLRKGQEAAALGVSLDFYAKLSTSDPLYSSLSHIEGRFRLIRAAARQANVLILSKGSIEAYYASPPSQSASDFDKQQALQAELDAIWNCKDLTLLRARYEEQLEYIEAAGFLSVPLSDMAREPVSDLVHLLQTDIRLARISNLEEAKRNARAVAEGYWDLCELIELNVKSATDYEGVIELKGWLGGEKIKFSQETHAYNIAIGASKGATEKKQAAQLSS